MTNPTGPELRIDRAHSARMYDYWLGGKDNYAADRAAGDAVIADNPYALPAAQGNRQFMHRSTRWVAKQGIDQFLDIGTGIPTEPNLHQVAQEVNPDARVVYVDHDPVVLAHAAALMRGGPRGRTVYVQADVRDVEKILTSDELLGALDLGRPVGLSMVALLHFVVDDDEARRIVRVLLDAVPSGSYLVISHLTADLAHERITRASATYRQSGVQLRPRTQAEVESLFLDTEIIYPGIVEVQEWNPEPGDLTFNRGDVSVYGAVARKP